MRIMFNCLTMENGGAERVISVLANCFSKDNIVSINMIKNTDVKYELDKNIKIFKVDKVKDRTKNKFLRNVSKLSISRFVKLKKNIEQFKPDIIISFLPEPSFRLMLLKKFFKSIRNIPVVVSIRNDPNTEYKNVIIKRIMINLYKKLDGIVLQTENAKNYFDNLLPDIANSVIIPNPVSKKFIKDELFTGKREKVIVSVGRLEKQKNHKLLIDAFEKFIVNNKDYKLKIFGNGNLANELEKVITDKGLNGKVLLMGNVDGVENFIFNASCFILSSDYEGMPNALMEAMTLGLPCISTDCPCGGPKDLIENYKNGILVPVNDAEILSKSLDELCNNPTLQKEVSSNAYCSMKKYYPEFVIKKWGDLINTILKSR